MKRNIFWSMLTIFMVTALCVGFASCGDDDDSSSNSTRVVGSWSVQEGKRSLTLTFKNNGTGTAVSEYYDSYSGTETDTETFNYVMEGEKKGKIFIKLYDSYSGIENATMFFVIEGTTMLLFEDDYYDDLEWTLTKK